MNLPCQMLRAASFSFKTLPQSILVILFIWHGGKAERIPRFEKNPKIWCSKTYLNSF